MKQLFEIPVYALSPSLLDIRVGQRITTLEKLFIRSDTDNSCGGIIWNR